MALKTALKKLPQKLDVWILPNEYISEFQLTKCLFPANVPFQSQHNICAQKYTEKMVCVSLALHVFSIETVLGTFHGTVTLKSNYNKNNTKSKTKSTGKAVNEWLLYDLFIVFNSFWLGSNIAA